LHLQSGYRRHNTCSYAIKKAEALKLN